MLHYKKTNDDLFLMDKELLVNVIDDNGNLYGELVSKHMDYFLSNFVYCNSNDSNKEFGKLVITYHPRCKFIANMICIYNNEIIPAYFSECVDKLIDVVNAFDVKEIVIPAKYFGFQYSCIRPIVENKFKNLTDVDVAIYL